MKVFASLILLLSLCNSAHALNSWGTDMSDLWWVPSESGWGANIAHQREVIFITIFAYGPDGSTRWYVGPAVVSSGGSNPFLFTGDLYETRGPFLGGAFNPANVTNRRVGNVSLSFSSTSRAALTYMVDGITVSKAIERQTFREARFSGIFHGYRVGRITGCAAAGGYIDELSASPVKSGSSITVTTISSVGQACTYSGTFSQAGRMSRIGGSFVCTPGSSGSFTMYELEIGAAGFTARYQATYSGCTDTGVIAAARDD